MDSSFFSSENKDVRVKLVEIETKTRGEPDKTGFIFVVSSNEFESDDFFGLKLVLHEIPVHHTSIGGDGVEVVLLGNIGVPVHLPDRVGVLLGSHIRLVNRTFVLISDIIDQHSTVIKTNGQQSRTTGMEIEGHDSAFGSKTILRVSGVLDGIQTNESHSLSKEIIGPKTNGK